MKRIMMVAAAIGGLSLAASAQPPATPQPVRDRIQQGVQTGSLMPAELAVAGQQQRQLHRQVARSRRSGRGITPRERAHIRANAAQNRRLLYRLKHNQRHR